MTIDIKKLIQLPIFYKKEKNNPPFLVKQGDYFQFQNKNKNFTKILNINILFFNK